MVIVRRQYHLLLTLMLVILVFSIIFSTSRLQRKWEQRDQGKKVQHVWPSQLVFGPAAGEGLSDRLQCEGVKAIGRVGLSRNPNSGQGISFVTFFTINNAKLMGVDDRLSDLVTVGNVSLNKADRSLAILHTYIDFIQVSMPKSKIIVLTDPKSSFSVNRVNTILLPFQGNYNRDHLMLQRIETYIEFLHKKLQEIKGAEFPANYVLTDSDMAVVEDLGQIFEKYPNFHVALTFRNNKRQPLNSGFIAVRGTREGITKAMIFLEQVLEVYTSKFIGSARMLGDQLSLVYVVKDHILDAEEKFSMQEPFAGVVKGVSVMFLPCALYNWTPPEGAGQFHGMPLDVKVVHFKGRRKRLMLESWNFFNSTANMSDMLCLVLRSGRTKYDF